MSAPGISPRRSDGLAVALLVFMALIPVPLGANPAPAAMAGTAAIGLIGAVFLWCSGDGDRLLPADSGPVLGLWLLLLAGLALQIAPLGMVGLSHTIVDADGRSFTTDRISLAPGETWLMLIRTAAYGGFLLLCLKLTARRDRARTIAPILLLVFAAHAVAGLVSLLLLGDTLLLVKKWAYAGSATGTFVNRNSFATFLAIGLVLGVTLCLRAALTGRVQRGDALLQTGAMLVATLVILATLMATQSRMGLLSGFAGVLAVLIGTAAKAENGRSLLPLFAAAGLLAGLALFVFGSGTLERLTELERALEVRLALYRQVIEMIASQWLLGFGGGSFEVAYPLFQRPPVNPELVWDKAHNTYLGLWSELGIVLGSLPILIVGLLAARLFGLYRKRGRDWWLALAGLSAVLVVGLHALVDFSMEIPAVVHAFLFVVALGLGTPEPEREG